LRARAGDKLQDGRRQFAAAMAKPEDDDKARQNADFTLSDLNGKRWCSTSRCSIAFWDRKGW